MLVIFNKIAFENSVILVDFKLNFIMTVSIFNYVYIVLTLPDDWINWLIRVINANKY